MLQELLSERKTKRQLILVPTEDIVQLNNAW